MRMSFSISRRKPTSSASHSEIAMPSAPVRAVEAGALFSVLGFWHGRLLLTRTAKHVWRSLGVAKLARCKGWMAYGQRIETVEKTVSCRFRRSLPGAAGYDFWASNCESAGVEDEWIGRAFWPSSRGRWTKSCWRGSNTGRRKSHPEGPVEGADEALGRRASQARRDRSSIGRFLGEVATVARPDTILAWYRKLVL
jgi:hypothetical protein